MEITSHDKCCYCGISQEELNALHTFGFLRSKRYQRGKALENEHLDPFRPGKKNEINLAKACYLCNNAKNDIVSAVDFKAYWAKGIRDYYNRLLEAQAAILEAGREFKGAKPFHPKGSVKILFADLLNTEFPLTYNAILEAIKSYGYTTALVSGCKEPFIRDFARIQVDSNLFVQFVFDPDYLRLERYVNLKTDPLDYSRYLSKYTEKDSDLIIDGGNVLLHGEFAFVTSKIFIDNHSLDFAELYKQLCHALAKKVVLVPYEAHDYAGHIDTYMRIINDDTVFVCKGDTTTVPALNAQTGKKWKQVELPYYEVSRKADKEGIDCTGLYINYLELPNVVLVPQFGHKKDEPARELIEKHLNKPAKSIDCKALAKKGGLLNCIAAVYYI